MANDTRKVSQLGITTTLSANDRVVVLANTVGNVQTKTITLTNFTNKLSTANSSSLGVVKIGSGINVDANGVVSVSYLTAANSSSLGVVKIGSGINVDANGVVSVSYLAANSSNWEGSPPTSSQEAIDRFAALIKTIYGFGA